MQRDAVDQALHRQAVLLDRDPDLVLPLGGALAPGADRHSLVLLVDLDEDAVQQQGEGQRIRDRGRGARPQPSRH